MRVFWRLFVRGLRIVSGRTLNTNVHFLDHMFDLLETLHAFVSPTLYALLPSCYRGVKNYAYVSSGGMYKDSDEVGFSAEDL